MKNDLSLDKLQEFLSYDGSRWRAQIAVNGKNKYLGNFITKEAASDAYMKAKFELHPFGEIAKSHRWQE